MSLSNSEIVIILRQELTRALGFDSDELAANRLAALDMYLVKPRGDEQAGRSSIQSSDVADMVEAITASINPILTRDTLVKFEPTGEEDEQQAEQESEFVQYMAGHASNQFLEITSAVKDALLCRNGWLKVYIDEEKHTEKVTRTGMMEFQVQQQIEESNKQVTWQVRDLEPEIDDDGSELPTYKVKFNRHTHIKELRIESIAPENMLYSPEHNSPELRGLRFLAERKMLTRSELREMGYSKKVVDDLPAHGADLKQDSKARRVDKGQDDTAADTSQENIETFVIHTWLDVDGTGIAKLWHCHLAEHELLMKERAEWMPYSTGSPVLMPHRLTGLSIYDKLHQLQNTKTSFLRMWVDNGNAINNARIVFNPRETESDDVADTVPGSGIRSKNPQNVVQLQTSDMGASIAQALTYMDKVRSERTGASLDLGSAEFQLAGNNIGNQGAERQISLREQLASQMTANLANTLLKDAFTLVHTTIREFLPGEITANLQGKWQQTNPSDWPERNHCTVATGLSLAEKSQMMQALTAIVTAQLQIIKDAPGQLVDLSGIYNALLDWGRAANIDAPEQYWIDPASQEAQQAAQQQRQSTQQQQQQVKAEMDSARQQELMVFYMQQFLDKYKADQETKFKYDDALLDAEIEEAKIVGEATLDLERQQQVFEQQALGAAAAVAPPPAPGAAPGV